MSNKAIDKDYLLRQLKNFDKDILSETYSAIPVEITQARYNALTQEEKMNGTIYLITDASNVGGTTVVANPSGIATDDLEKLQIGSTIYEIPDTTYESKQASQGGTDVSLVTTGEKYTWNEKVSKSSTAGLLKSDGTVDQTQYVSDISGKTDKVNNATNGNFAGLDSNGNLTDSGKKASDFKLASAHDAWSEVTNKPFSSVGDSLTTSNDALKVDTTFTQASSRENIATNETIPTILGKIKKWFADLGDLAFLNKDGTSSTKYLRGDGTWQTIPSAETIQVSTMPTASSSNVGKIYQFIGTTTSSYTNGLFYKCVLENSTYKWVNISTSDLSDYYSSNMQPISTLGDNDWFPLFSNGNGKRQILWSDMKSEISGGGIDGSTVTPTGVVATWLACAGLHQSYTTLNEVLADSGVLSALMESTNAVDYLVRSTTWAATICADKTAMNYIGENNYCADILLADSTWRTAICNSTYFEEVLNAKIPAMTSNTTPIGQASGTSFYTGYPYYQAFDNNSNTVWNDNAESAGNTARVWYKFAEPLKPLKAAFRMNSSRVTSIANKYTFIGSNDGVNWTTLIDVNSSEVTQNVLVIKNLNTNTSYKYLGLQYLKKESYAASIAVVQFYGRADLPPVDDRINAKANKTDIAYVENGTTASRAYSIGQQFYYNGSLYKAKAAIAQGATFTVGTNCELAGSITEQISNSCIIDTNEHLIGSFMGAPLYRKAFSVNQIVRTADTWVENTVSGVGVGFIVTKAYIVHNNINNTLWYLQNVDAAIISTNTINILDFRTTTITVGSNAGTIYLVLEYTKK